jgi:predicted transcriptional regulator
MSKIREVVRLDELNCSRRQIAEGLNISRRTVQKYIESFLNKKITYESIKNLKDDEFESIVSEEHNENIKDT